MAERSLPEEAWLQPGPEPALRGNDRNVKRGPDISVAVYLTFNYQQRPIPAFVSPLVLCFWVRLFEQVQTGLLSFVSANVVVVSC